MQAGRWAREGDGRAGYLKILSMLCCCMVKSLDFMVALERNPSFIHGFLSILNLDEGTNVQILGAGSAKSAAKCRMGCRLYLVRVFVTTVCVGGEGKVDGPCCHA